jgi:hypothetical protein
MVYRAVVSGRTANGLTAAAFKPISRSQVDGVT